MYLWEGAGFERVKTAAFWVVLRAVNFRTLCPTFPLLSWTLTLWTYNPFPKFFFKRPWPCCFSTAVEK